MFCPRCGKSCQDTDKFCVSCGGALKSSQTIQSDAVQTPVPVKSRSQLQDWSSMASDRTGLQKMKQQKKSGCAQVGGGCLIIIIMLSVLFFMLLKSCNNHTAGTAVTKPLSKIDKSTDMQAQRKQFTEKLISKGVFAKVEASGSFPHVWIEPAFYSLDFKTKENFVSVVYSYYFDGNNYGDTVYIVDNISGKEVGDYSLANPGLKLK